MKHVVPVGELVAFAQKHVVQVGKVMALIVKNVGPVRKLVAFAGKSLVVALVQIQKLVIYDWETCCTIWQTCGVNFKMKLTSRS